MQLVFFRQIKSTGAQRTTVAPINNLLCSTGSSVADSSGLLSSTGIAMLIQPPFNLSKLVVIDSFRLNPESAGFFGRNLHSGTLLC